MLDSKDQIFLLFLPSAPRLNYGFVSKLYSIDILMLMTKETFSFFFIYRRNKNKNKLKHNNKCEKHSQYTQKIKKYDK
jgi:hypothetical protein